mmetsp:Transcript_14770/g.41590  ORF Transcript_14770/g.41590 Transcript_14770/m.41590 type:complete len:333 (-) Transcript_14770:273-1271(-)
MMGQCLLALLCGHIPNFHSIICTATRQDIAVLRVPAEAHHSILVAPILETWLRFLFLLSNLLPELLPVDGAEALALLIQRRQVWCQDPAEAGNGLHAVNHIEVPQLYLRRKGAYRSKVPRLLCPVRVAVHPRQGQREGGQHDLVVDVDVGLPIPSRFLIQPHLHAAHVLLISGCEDEEVRVPDVEVLNLAVLVRVQLKVGVLLGAAQLAAQQPWQLYLILVIIAIHVKLLQGRLQLPRLHSPAPLTQGLLRRRALQGAGNRTRPLHGVVRLLPPLHVGVVRLPLIFLLAAVPLLPCCLLHVLELLLRRLHHLRNSLSRPSGHPGYRRNHGCH